ncbi:HNH endonuclease family protein [Rhizobium sp. PAMB 3174]
MGLSVEYILPSNWAQHWPLPDGSLVTGDEKFQALYSSEEANTRIGSVVRRNRLMNTFGNLTILTQPLNSSVQNGPYSSKRDALLEHSLLVLNKEVTKQEAWGEDQIEERGKQLFEVAKAIWAYPLISTSNIGSSA